MAIWGAKLYESDCTCDMRDTFLRLLGEGLAPELVKKQILEEFAESFSDSDECDAARLALAELLWSVGALSEKERMDILSFLKAGGDILFWQENAPHMIDFRRRELKRLERQLGQHSPPQVRKKIRAKQFLWEVGQIYALPIHDASAATLQIQNEFLLLYVYAEAEPVNGYRVPLVWAKLTQNGVLPGSAEEFHALPYIQISCTAMEDRFKPFSSREELPQKYWQDYLPDAWGYLPEFSMMIYESRGNHPPKDLQLLGTFEGIKPPEYNYRRYKSSHGAAWRYLEEYLLQRYRLHNLHQAQFYKK